MGGSSKSDSKQQTTTTQTDNRIGAADAAQVAASGGTIRTSSKLTLNQESVDPEIAQAALSEAFGFGGEALSFGRRALKSADLATDQALELGGDTVGRALELTERALVGAQGAFGAGLEQNRALVEATVARGSEDLQGLKGLLSTTAIVAVGAFALIGMMRR